LLKVGDGLSFATNSLDSVGDETMKGDTTVIEHLNKVLKNELTAINQYFLHSRILKDWGINKLGDYEYDESVDEMKHADLVIERILFLDGLPNLQDLGKLQIGENVPEILQCDLNLELDAIPDLKAGITYCEAHKDFVTRNIFDSILKSEEEHIDWLETQIGLVEKTGIENFIQSQT
jgi:bacterioferritin